MSDDDQAAGRTSGLNDPRAVDILTTEHWSLLSARALGYQEMFGRSTVFVTILSGIVIAVTLMAQATHFGRDTLLVALLLISVALFIGLTTFIRSVAINYEDAVWIAGMKRLREAYLQIVPELDPFFVSAHASSAERKALAHGAPQRLENLANSLTTTSSVVAALNSTLVGSLAGDIAALCGTGLALVVTSGVTASLVSAVLHVRYAGRFRRRHAPPPELKRP